MVGLRWPPLLCVILGSRHVCQALRRSGAATMETELTEVPGEGAERVAARTVRSAGFRSGRASALGLRVSNCEKGHPYTRKSTKIFRPGTAVEGGRASRT